MAKEERERAGEALPESPGEPQRKKEDVDGPLGVYCYLAITVLIIGVSLSGMLALFGRGSWSRFLILLAATVVASPVLVKLARWRAPDEPYNNKKE